MSEADVEWMRCLPDEATSKVSREYFILPVANVEGAEQLTQYRERVYAYELYHQLRSIWPAWPYSLAGEVDKSDHPLIRGGDLDNAKPDLLVHVPGEMERNLLTERKHARAVRRQEPVPRTFT